MMMGRGMNISPDKIGGSYGIPMGIQPPNQYGAYGESSQIYEDRKVEENHFGGGEHGRMSLFPMAEEMNKSRTLDNEMFRKGSAEKQQNEFNNEFKEREHMQNK